MITDEECSRAIDALPIHERLRREMEVSNLDESWKQWKGFYASAWDALVHQVPGADPHAIAMKACTMADVAEAARLERYAIHKRQGEAMMLTGKKDV